MNQKVTPALNAQQCQRVLVIAHSRARAIGLMGDDPDDCALAFVGHLLDQIDRHPQATLSHLQSSPWLFRCADNWAKNYARQHYRRNAHEQPWPQEALEQNDSPATEISSELPDPEQRLLSQELTHRLDMALNCLTPTQRALFRRHCLEGETLAHIAETTDRSPEAVRQSMCLLRRRMQNLLMETGLNHKEAMDYLYQILTMHR